jgi:hypothetical protein
VLVHVANGWQASSYGPPYGQRPPTVPTVNPTATLKTVGVTPACRRLALSVVDLDAAMRRQCTHVNWQARGDILVHATDVEITDRVQGQGCSWKQFVLDVKTGYHLGREMECWYKYIISYWCFVLQGCQIEPGMIGSKAFRHSWAEEAHRNQKFQLSSGISDFLELLVPAEIFLKPFFQNFEAKNWISMFSTMRSLILFFTAR